MSNSNRWVEKRDSGIRGNTFLSSAERRLVWFSGGAAKVKSIGTHRVGFLELIDAVGAVMMTPTVVSFSETASLASIEGVPISVTVDAVLRVRDNEASIASAALFADEQEKVICTEVYKSCQSQCKERPYLGLHSSVSDLSFLIQQALLESALVAQSCFEVLGVTITKIISNDEELANTLVQRARALEQAAVAEREAQLQMHATQHQISTETMVDNARGEAVRRKSEAEHQAAIKKAELLKTFEGLLALEPTLALRLREMELEKERFALEQSTKVKVEEVRAVALQAEFVQQVYNKIYSVRNIRTEERAANLTAIVPALLKGVTNVNVSLPPIEESPDEIEKSLSATPPENSTKDS